MPFNPGYFFLITGIAATSLGWLIGGLTVAAGNYISKRKSYLFIQVASAVLCLNVPFGTALGVFSPVTLGRPSVLELF